MKNQFLLINEMANLFHISPHTLRFYEKKGLLKPSKVSAKGYRLYGFRSIRQLERLLFLRSIDMSIDQIRIYLNNTNAGDYISQLNQLDIIVSEKLNKLKAVKNQIGQNKIMATEYLNNKYELFIKVFDKRVLLPLKKISSPYVFDIRVPDFYQSVSNKPEHAQLQFSKNLVVITAENESRMYIELKPEDMPFIPPEQCFELPEGPYLCSFHTSTCKNDYEELHKKFKTHAAGNNLSLKPVHIEIHASDYSIYTDHQESSFLQRPVLE